MHRVTGDLLRLAPAVHGKPKSALTLAKAALRQMSTALVKHGYEEDASGVNLSRISAGWKALLMTGEMCAQLGDVEESRSALQAAFAVAQWRSNPIGTLRALNALQRLAEAQTSKHSTPLIDPKGLHAQAEQIWTGLRRASGGSEGLFEAGRVLSLTA